jgi:hypothetical protein
MQTVGKSVRGVTRKSKEAQKRKVNRTTHTFKEQIIA